MPPKEKRIGHWRVKVKRLETKNTLGSLTSSVLTAALKSQTPQPEASLPPATQVDESDDAAIVTSKAIVAYKTSEKSKKTKVCCSLTKMEEQNMVEWLEENPIIYNKKLKTFKDTKKKEYLWREKAAEFGKVPAELKIWYTSLRTRFGRLKKKKSRHEDKEMTERDEWVYNHFQFLTPHVHEVQPRTLPKQKITQSAESMGHLSKDDNLANSEMVIGCDNKTSEEQDGSNHLSTSSLTQSKRPLDNEAITTGMQEGTNKILDIHEECMQRLCNKDGEREAFVDWMRSAINELDRGLWRRCQHELASILYRFQSENDNLKKASSITANAIGAIPDIGIATSYQLQPAPMHWLPPPNPWQSQSVYLMAQPIQQQQRQQMSQHHFAQPSQIKPQFVSSAAQTLTQLQPLPIAMPTTQGLDEVITSTPMDV